MWKQVTELLLPERQNLFHPDAQSIGSCTAVRVYCGLTSYENIYSFIDLDGRGRDANVKRSAGITKPDDGDTTTLKTSGDKDAAFSAAKRSADTRHNSKQQSWA